MPSETYAGEADYFGIASGRNTDKFEATGLTPVKSELVDAPYIREFPMILECKLLLTYELGLHTYFVGKIMDVKVDADMLDDRGMPDIEKVRPLIFAPEVRKYYGIGEHIGQAFEMGKKL